MDDLTEKIRRSVKYAEQVRDDPDVAALLVQAQDAVDTMNTFVAFDRLMDKPQDLADIVRYALNVCWILGYRAGQVAQKPKHDGISWEE